MGRRPTIVDVAREAGVSKSTVSLVLQGSPLVKRATREAVEQAMAAVGYVYNRAAANLRGRGRDLVGLVINDLRNPFFTEFAASAQETFARHGYATVIANTDEDADLQADVVASMIEHGVTAFLISPAYDGEVAFDLLARADIPAMQVLRLVDGRTDVFPFASLDYITGGRLAAEHLIELGVREIAFVGGLEARAVTVERMTGFEDVMRAHGREPVVLYGRPSRAFGRDAARVLRQHHGEVDAAVCFSDLVALGMLSGFAELGVAVGTEFRVVGFDDIEECALVFPQLTSVRCDVKRFGERAAEAMLRWVEDDEAPPPVQRVPVTLVPRQSTLGVRPQPTP
jgi:LacI family transcriptional regulator